MSDEDKKNETLKAAQADELDRTVYVVHPVTPELKAEIRGKGGIIKDARFAPEGAEIFDPHPKPKAPAPKKPAPKKEG